MVMGFTKKTYGGEKNVFTARKNHYIVTHNVMIAKLYIVQSCQL